MTSSNWPPLSIIQAIGVFISSVIIKLLGDSAKLADPICTLLFSIIVISTTVSVLKDTVRILMEGKPAGVVYADVREALGHIDHVVAVHDLRIWSLTANRTILTVHLAVDPGSDKEAVLTHAQKCLNAKFGIDETTIQVEDWKSASMGCCDDCNVDLE